MIWSFYLNKYQNNNKSYGISSTYFGELYFRFIRTVLVEMYHTLCLCMCVQYISLQSQKQELTYSNLCIIKSGGFPSNLHKSNSVLELASTCFLSTSPQLCVQWQYIGSLKSTTVGVLIPQKSANITDQGFISPENQLLNIYQHITAYE